MIVELRRLNGIREGLTVNTGVIEGGVKSNVVADLAKASIDLRVMNKSDGEYFEEQLRSLCGREFVKGVRIEFTGGITNPPMERTARTRKLVEWASEAGQEVGIKVEDVATGGGSDGNIIAQLGIPVLDGLGPQGGRAHNAAEEYVLRDSIVPRVSLLARLIEIICERRNDLKIN
jgi:glutamate carboxypeptidase